ncbi:unnamed protein product [Lampetra planeri]
MAGVQPHLAVAESERPLPDISSGVTHKSGGFFSSDARQQSAAIVSAVQPPPIARFGAGLRRMEFGESLASSEV